MQTGKLINGISNRLRRRSQVVQKRIGISGAQGNVLDYILVESENHPVYQKEIEKEFGLRPPTATGTLGPYLSKPKEASLRSRTGNTKARNAEPLANKYFNSYIGERIRT